MTDAQFFDFNQKWIDAVLPCIVDGGLLGTFITAMLEGAWSATMIVPGFFSLTPAPPPRAADTAIRSSETSSQLRKRLVDVGFSDDLASSRLEYSGPPIHARIAGSIGCYGALR
jgi:hypothetical protein